MPLGTSVLFSLAARELFRQRTAGAQTQPPAAAVSKEISAQGLGRLAPQGTQPDRSRSMAAASLEITAAAQRSSGEAP